MSQIPDDLRYTEEHEWIRVDGDRATVGITDHAQEELTDIVYVELPEVGASFAAGEEIAVVESVKAASEIYAPVGGEVVEVNGALDDRPELINDDPYGEGWIIVLRFRDEGELEDLLDPGSYRALTEE